MNHFTFKLYHPMAISFRRTVPIILFALLAVTAVLWLMGVQPAQALVDCNDNSWLVGIEADLNDAINCYNSKPAGSYTITLTQNISLTASTVTINNPTAGVALLLEGNSNTVDGQNISGVRPFFIAANTNVTIQNIIISGGDSGLYGSGGGIYNSGILTVNNSIISDNATNGYGHGGGILNAGILTINNSTVHHNSTRYTSSGGGIFNINNGTLTINNSTIRDNTAGNSGGGIYNQGASTIINSTINSNVVYYGGGRGGGIFNTSALTITNSTVSGNLAAPVAGGNGGGIYSSASATTTLNNNTLSDNSSRYGGGVYSYGNTLSINNSIIANSLNGGDCYGTVVDNGYNIVEDNSCGFTGNSDPMLGPLQDNGGATFTQALLSGSPAIDAGNTILATDQRGISRPQGLSDDIGAFELVFPQQTLDIVKDGAGSGSITSVPAGIDCGSTCSFDFDFGAAVTLTATADSGSIFTGWSGTASGTSNPITLTMDTAKSVTATFTLETYALTVSTDGTGSGTVTSSPVGIDCGNTCLSDFDFGTVVTLTAVADTGSAFTGWSGAITSANDLITLTMDAAKSVTATFALETYTLTVNTASTGSGTVTSSPAGINCGNTCSSDFDFGTVVTLTAMADTGSAFTGWSGAVTSTSNPITLTIDTAKSVTATFDINATLFLPVIIKP